MPTTIDRAELEARLDEFLARAAAGERILVRDAAGHIVALGPAEEGRPVRPGPARRRHRGRRTIEEVLAEDRGA
jgi:antitoxin (DNA-binding transcriptional repressor) of toxin-antitoxin stability system